MKKNQFNMFNDKNGSFYYGILKIIKIGLNQLHKIIW